MKEISVTMSRAMYDLLLKGRKATKDEVGIKACKNYEGVVAYVDESYGLQGKVAEVIVE